VVAEHLRAVGLQHAGVEAAQRVGEVVGARRRGAGQHDGDGEEAHHGPLSYALLGGSGDQSGTRRVRASCTAEKARIDGPSHSTQNSGMPREASRTIMATPKARPKTLTTWTGAR